LLTSMGWVGAWRRSAILNTLSLKPAAPKTI
jgi:hypothetical protein